MFSISLKRIWFFVLFDAILSFLSLLLAYSLRFNFEIPDKFIATLPLFFVPLALLKLFALWFFGVYRIPWRFFSLDGMERIAKAHIFAYMVFGLLYILFAKLQTGFIFPRSAIFIDFALSMILIGALRISKRVYESKNSAGKACVIVGADRNGELMARYLASKDSLYQPLFFVDNDPEKEGLRIQNLPVVSFEALPNLAKRYQIESAIVTGGELDELYHALSKSGIFDLQIAKSLSSEKTTLEAITIEDLLARSPKDLDKDAISKFVAGKRVLITGAGGSIGSELARSAIKYGAASLALVDNSEFGLYKIGEELEGKRVELVLLSVLDKTALDQVFERYKPQIVLHAAAYKHVNMVEKNPQNAIKNNILGTKIVVDLAIKHESESFVLISTDKAVRPTSIMGATKRVCELYVQSVNPHQTTISAVRFGNVLGSSGSVVPKFRELIAKNRPLTVTHAEVTRYFMLISEAVELVLQAASLAKGGEVFVLDMGEPVKIVDLARKMLELAGRSELGIVYTGLKNGEKLYEELLIDESDKKTKYPSIFVGAPIESDFDKLSSLIDKLLVAPDQLEVLREIVPEFNHFKEGL